MSYRRALFAHLRKDLRIEWRTKESVNGMLFFSLLIVVVFSLAFDPTAFPTVARQISGGLLWVGLLFAAMTALNGSWARELRNGTLDAQRLSPAPPSALFLGKAIANFLFVLAVEAVLSIVFVLFYNLHALGNAWWFLLILPLGTWALVSNGTFFAALGLRTRNRELLLPVLLIPIALPALLAMIQASTAILTGEAGAYVPWIKLLAAYDILFTAVALLTFPLVLHAD